MTNVQLDGPVGLRHNKTNVRNLARDQDKVMKLLMQVKAADGGKKDAWGAVPLPGGDGNCPTFLVDAIWDFQKHWTKRGRFRNPDGVIDPGGNTLKFLNSIAGGGAPPPLPKRPSAPPVVESPRAPGTWQVTNVWSTTIGEVGQAGNIVIEITQPDERKFVVGGVGGGFGYSLDPMAVKDALNNLKALNPFANLDPAKLAAGIELLGRSVGFSIGDYLQLFGKSLDSVTDGRLIANPINKYVGRPQSVSRYLITEAGNANFAIASVGASFQQGAEAGLLAFGGPAVGPLMLTCPVIGYYGSKGTTWKFGAGAQIMMYCIVEVADL